MKNTKWIFLLTAIFIVLTGCGGEKASTSSHHTDIADEFVIYGINIGDSHQTLTKKIGVPLDKYTEKNGGREFVTYSYANIEVSLADDRIEAIYSTDMEFTTKRGLTIGDSFEQFVVTYGDLDIRGYSGGYYTSNLIMGAFLRGDDTTLAFTFDYFAHDEPPTIAMISMMSNRLADAMFSEEEFFDLRSADDWNVRHHDDDQHKQTSSNQPDGRHHDAVQESQDNTPIVREEDIHTTLIKAANTGNIAEVIQLLEKGADPNYKDTEGLTVLSSTISLDSDRFPDKSAEDVYNIVKALLDAGADPNLVSEFYSEGYYHPVLLDTVIYDLPDVAELLLEAGARPSITDNFGWTPLSYAKDEANEELVLLIQSYMNNDDRLLEAVVQNQYAEAVELLVNLADPNAYNALLIAASNGNAELVELLLIFDADPSPKPHFGSTPLFASIWSEDADIVGILLKAGAQPDQADHPELWSAVDNGWTEIVKLLLDYGADPQSKGWRGESPLEVAIESGNDELIRLLKEAGAE